MDKLLGEVTPEEIEGVKSAEAPKIEPPPLPADVAALKIQNEQAREDLKRRVSEREATEIKKISQDLQSANPDVRQAGIHRMQIRDNSPEPPDYENHPKTLEVRAQIEQKWDEYTNEHNGKITQDIQVQIAAATWKKVVEDDPEVREQLAGYSEVKNALREIEIERKKATTQEAQKSPNIIQRAWQKVRQVFTRKAPPPMPQHPR